MDIAARLQGTGLAAIILVVSGAPSGAADTARGAYLAEAAGCGSCHTDNERQGPAYAGGRRLTTEFGIVTTPNITPDKATGIGRWSDADFARAMRWGIAPDDSHYVPVFPFASYNRLTEADLADIKAYLGSLPPVSRPDLAGAGSTALWERARAAVAVAATPLPGAWRDDPARDPVWNRGAYLVAGIGRCGECHTPRTRWGAFDPQRFLAGGRDLVGKKSPNITPDAKTGIGNWSEAEIVTVLTDGATPNFDEVGHSMAEIVRNTARLTEEDRRAIAVYLRTVPAVSTPEQK